MCLAVAEQQEDEVVGIHSQLADQKLNNLVQADTISKSDYLGKLWGTSARKDYWMNNRRGFMTLDDDDIYTDT